MKDIGGREIEVCKMYWGERNVKEEGISQAPLLYFMCPLFWGRRHYNEHRAYRHQNRLSQDPEFKPVPVNIKLDSSQFIQDRIMFSRESFRFHGTTQIISFAIQRGNTASSLCTLTSSWRTIRSVYLHWNMSHILISFFDGITNESYQHSIFSSRFYFLSEVTSLTCNQKDMGITDQFKVV